MAKSRRQNRAKFVRSFDVSVPVADVLERAREEGIPLTATDVHSARYYERKKQKSEPPTARKGNVAKPSRNAVARDSATQTEQTSAVLELAAGVRTTGLKFRPDELRALQKLIVRVGCDRMRALVDLVERQLDSVAVDGSE